MEKRVRLPSRKIFTALGAVCALIASTAVISASVAGRAQKTYKAVVRGNQLDIGVEAYEPTIAFTPDGSMFYVAGTPSSGDHRGQMWVLKSNDDGRTWLDVTPPIVDSEGNDATEFYDPFLTSDPITGRLFRATMGIALYDGGQGCVELASSDDEGKTWTSNRACGGLTKVFRDHENLVTGPSRGFITPEGYENLVHLCTNHLQATSCITSPDGGTSWGVESLVFPSVGPAGWCGGLNEPPQTDSTGRVFVPRHHCDQPKVAVSEDDGQTWEIHVISTEHVATRQDFVEGTGVRYIDLDSLGLAVDDDDGLHATWRADDGRVYYARSKDHGASWTEAIPISIPKATEVAGSFVEIAAKDGQIAIGYIATESKFGENWEGARWNVYLAVGRDARHLNTTRINPLSDPIGTNDCGVTRCTPCPEDQSCGGWFDFMDVEFAPDGQPWVAFVDSCHKSCRKDGVLDYPSGSVGTVRVKN